MAPFKALPRDKDIQITNKQWRRDKLLKRNFFIDQQAKGNVDALPLRWFEAGREVPPFLATIALFLLGFLGLAISNFPYLVPPSLTVWETAATPKADIAMTRLFFDPKRTWRSL